MEPLAVLTSVLKYLYAAAEDVQHNREECHRLATHTQAVLRLIQSETDGDVPPTLSENLHHLIQTIQDLNSTLDGLSNQTPFKKILWRGRVAKRIADADNRLAETIELFQLGTRLDLHRFEAERQQARNADTERMHAKLDGLQHSEHEILEHLDIKNAQMQEAMIALHKRFLTFEDNLEQRFLEKAQFAMQRRSGGMKSAPDEFVITSLDVLIHRHKKVGEGGFGQVYEAEWQGSLVAVKVLAKNVSRIVFEKEIDVWKRLRHPNVLQFFGACSIADPPFLVCALKSQGDAVHFLLRKPSADRRKIITDSAYGLRYLHQHNVVHGDLKASNILIDEYENACLCDFGLSKIRTHTTTVSDPSQASTNVGSPRWMAPEQMTMGIIRESTDIYSFGMTIYEIFTGSPPFAHTLDHLLVSMVVDRGMRPPRPTEPSIIQSGLDDDYWKLVEDCWAQDPKDRPVVTTVVKRLCSMRRRISDVQSIISDEISATTVCPTAGTSKGQSLAVDTTTHTISSPMASPSSFTPVHDAPSDKVQQGTMDSPRTRPPSISKRISSLFGKQSSPSVATTDVESFSPRNSIISMEKFAPELTAIESRRDGSNEEDKKPKRKFPRSFSSVEKDNKKKKPKSPPQKKDPNRAVRGLVDI